MLLEVKTVRLALTIATEPDQEKNLSPEHRHGICGVDQPPILLQEQPNGTYLVRDGHHRRLVAIARGDDTIQAYVCEYGFRSPTGSPFPYYWRKGEASVMWQGREWDYSAMWGGEWREGDGWVDPDSLDYPDSCESQSAESCESCKPQSSAPKAATSSQLKRVPWFLRQCYRLDCCGPYRAESQVKELGAFTRMHKMEQMGQFTLGV